MLKEMGTLRVVMDVDNLRVHVVPEKGARLAPEMAEVQALACEIAEAVYLARIGAAVKQSMLWEEDGQCEATT